MRHAVIYLINLDALIVIETDAPNGQEGEVEIDGAISLGPAYVVGDL